MRRRVELTGCPARESHAEYPVIAAGEGLDRMSLLRDGRAWLLQLVGRGRKACPPQSQQQKEGAEVQSLGKSGSRVVETVGVSAIAQACMTQQHVPRGPEGWYPLLGCFGALLE